VSTLKAYDFTSARERQTEWRSYYLRLKKAGDLELELEFEIMAYIDELEMEIAEAHASVNAKMTTVSSSGHKVIHIENLITPIISHWRGSSNEEAGHASK
jgi:hypothetical protein